MARMIIAGFNNRSDANEAVNRLEELGYTSEEISVIAKEGDVGETREQAVASDAAGGAATGGVIGGIAGLLAGAGIIPALAGLLIGGPIAAALGLTGIAATAFTGALTGAVAGGLIGALVGLGVPESAAKEYKETIDRGGVVLAAPLEDGNESEVRRIFEANGGQRVTEFDMPEEEEEEEEE